MFLFGTIYKVKKKKKKTLWRELCKQLVTAITKVYKHLQAGLQSQVLAR